MLAYLKRNSLGAAFVEALLEKKQNLPDVKVFVFAFRKLARTLEKVALLDYIILSAVWHGFQKWMNFTIENISSPQMRLPAKIKEKRSWKCIRGHFSRAGNRTSSIHCGKRATQSWRSVRLHGNMWRKPEMTSSQAHSVHQDKSGKQRKEKYSNY